MKRVHRFIALVCLLATLAVLLIACMEVEEEPTERLKTKNLTWAVSTVLPHAEDFIVDLPNGWTAEFAEQYSFSEIKEYPLTIRVTDDKGRCTSYEVYLNLILDQEAPTVMGLKDLSHAIGSGGVSYRAGVTLRDNCDGEVILEIDSSSVDLKTPGVYPVIYTAVDAAGNRASFRMSITVYREEITEAMLYEKLDAVLREIVHNGMTNEQKARAVYSYVHGHISYVATSDKSSVIRAAYEGITTLQGDCYTYFALSKAFFDRLGIANMEVQRLPSVAAAVDERHFWNLVNIGTDEDPRWYHFDACRIKEMPDPWGCLMTDAQIEEYSKNKANAHGVRDYFYAYDKASYPKTPDVIVTPIN